MRLTGERVTIRAFTAADAQAYLDYARDPAVAVPAGLQPIDTLAEAVAVVTNFAATNTGFAVTVADRLVGHIAVYERPAADGAPDPHSREIGYALAPAAWGHGYMQEALRLMLTVLAAHGVTAVWATVLPTNRRSIKVLARTGFAYVDTAPTGIGPDQQLAAIFVWHPEK